MLMQRNDVSLQVAFAAHRAGILPRSITDGFGRRVASAEEDEEAREEEARLGNLLIEAAKRGNVSDVKELLVAGARPTFQSGDIRKHTRIGLSREQGQSALHWAAIRGSCASKLVLASV